MKIVRIALTLMAIVCFVTVVYKALTRQTVGDLYDLVNGNITERVQKFYITNN